MLASSGTSERVINLSCFPFISTCPFAEAGVWSGSVDSCTDLAYNFPASNFRDALFQFQLKRAAISLPMGTFRFLLLCLNSFEQCTSVSPRGSASGKLRWQFFTLCSALLCSRSYRSTLCNTRKTIFPTRIVFVCKTFPGITSHAKWRAGFFSNGTSVFFPPIL